MVIPRPIRALFFCVINSKDRIIECMGFLESDRKGGGGGRREALLMITEEIYVTN